MKHFGVALLNVQGKNLPLSDESDSVGVDPVQPLESTVTRTKRFLSSTLKMWAQIMYSYPLI